MGIISANRHNSSTLPTRKVELGGEESVDIKNASVDKSITLKFPPNFTFAIRVEDGAMIVEAKLKNNVVFYLDQIPTSFIQDLKHLIREF